jgi:hypothetical protein
VSTPTRPSEAQPHESLIFEHCVAVLHFVRGPEDYYSDEELQEADAFASSVLTEAFKTAAVKIETERPELRVRWEGET